MGLDMYLSVKTKTKGNGLRGAAGGLIGICPSTEETDDSIEVGYWRKFYELDDYLIDLLSYREPNDVEYNCVPLEMDQSELNEVIDYLTQMIDEKDLYMRNSWGWDSREEYEEYLEESIGMFRKALSYLTTDPDARVYYMRWY